ncbi:MAG: transposase [Chloroflexi bacterium]|nr:transposase [Chloroflexota bacterium]
MDYYGLDIHKLSITYTCMNEEGQVLRRGQVATTPEAIREIVAPSGGQAWVALEATRGWSYVYDTLEPLGGHLFLTHPKGVKAIASARVKTDAIDPATLAHLLCTRLLPLSYAPPPLVRSWREMLRTRQGLVSMPSGCRNRVHE